MLLQVVLAPDGLSVQLPPALVAVATPRHPAAAAGSAAPAAAAAAASGAHSAPNNSSSNANVGVVWEEQVDDAVAAAGGMATVVLVPADARWGQWQWDLYPPLHSPERRAISQTTTSVAFPLHARAHPCLPSLHHVRCNPRWASARVAANQHTSKPAHQHTSTQAQSPCPSCPRLFQRCRSLPVREESIAARGSLLSSVAQLLGCPSPAHVLQWGRVGHKVTLVADPRDGAAAAAGGPGPRQAGQQGGAAHHHHHGDDVVAANAAAACLVGAEAAGERCQDWDRKPGPCSLQLSLWGASNSKKLKVGQSGLG